MKQFTIDEMSGDAICNCGCGQVAEERMMSETQREVRKEGKDIQGLNYTQPGRHDNGLTTKIGTTDHLGHNFKGEAFNNLMRMQQWQNRVMIADPTERRMANMMDSIHHWCSVFNMPRPVNFEAIRILKLADETGAVKGSLIIEFTAALIFIAAKRIGFIKALDEIVESMHARKKRVFTYVREIHMNLDLENIAPTPEKFINQICSQLNTKLKLERLALKILSKCKDKIEVQGKNPKGIAASCVHAACVIQFGNYKPTKYNITMQEIEDVAGITQVTMRNFCKEISDIIDKVKSEHAN